MLGGLTVCLVIIGCFFANRPRSRLPVFDLQRIQIACAEDMVKNTCAVMGAGGIESSRSASSSVFIAGVGVIDGESYRKIYESGQEMCSLVVGECTVDWNSKQCKIVRKIYLKNL